MTDITINDLDGMIEVYAECHAFVAQQSEGEWGDELVAQDARRLALFVTKQRQVARLTAIEQSAQIADKHGTRWVAKDIRKMREG